MNEEQGTDNTSSSLFSRVKLKGSTRLESAENYSIAGIVVGVIMFSIGVGLTAISTVGVSALLAIMGSFVSFVSTIVLIFVWLFRELKND